MPLCVVHVLELSYLLPVIGWFVIVPVSLIVGAGLTTRSLLSSMKKKAPQDLPTDSAGKRAYFFSVNAEQVSYAGAGMADPVAAMIFCTRKI
jgi:hypothetical protein